MTTTMTQFDIRDLRALGADIPKSVTDAEEILQGVRDRNVDQPQIAAVSKLKTVAPKDLPKVLDEISDAYARKTAFQAAAVGEILKVAEDRFNRAWAEARAGVLDGAQAKFADKVAEANELAERVSPALATDLNASTNPEALADAARLRVLMADLKKITGMTGTYVRERVPEHELTGQPITLIRLTDAPTDFPELHALQGAIRTAKGPANILTPSGLVALRAAGHRLVLHPLAEQISRMGKAWQSRQGYTVTPQGVFRVDPVETKRKIALQNTGGPSDN